jgi:hypothetical protein
MRPRRWEDDIKRDLREIGCGGTRSNMTAVDRNLSMVS